MLIIGLTGPTGAGKSTAARAFEALGLPVADADAASRAVTAQGSPCLAELAAAFSPAILAPDGNLDRAALAAEAFASPEGRALLNNITHKYILEFLRSRLASFEAAGAAAAVVDAPLLFESGFDKECGVTIAVLASPEERLARVTARDSLSLEAARARMRAQPNEEYYASRADYIIRNDASPEEVAAKVGEIYEEIMRK